MCNEKDFFYTGYNKDLKLPSRNLRNNMTPQEKKLWYQHLKTYPVRFNRQRPIGVYIADFYCSKAKLVIEIDGSQHYTEEGIAYDENRTIALNHFGVDVIRFTNSDIDLNFEGVCMQIDRVIKEKLQSVK